jgi:hypothetical protein
MRIRIGIGAAVLALSWSASPARAEEPRRATPRMAREAAEENAKTPAGRRYESALESSLDSWLRKSLERCVKGISKEQALSFNAFVQVGEKGEAEDVLFDPETDVARCAAPDFRGAKYPSPPQPSWWVKVEVQLK